MFLIYCNRAIDLNSYIGKTSYFLKTLKECIEIRPPPFQPTYTFLYKKKKNNNKKVFLVHFIKLQFVAYS